MYKSLKKILEEENLNISNNKYGTDKGDYKSYVDLFYEEYFYRLKDKKINLLEIGFRHGASLYLWSKYFKKGAILGLDNYSDKNLIKNPALQKWLQRKNIKTIICDAYSKKVAQGINLKFNIIIDDGPHTLRSQIISIFRYFPKLKKNGYFIIEDLLKGYITCLFLTLITPLNSKVKIFNFRKHKFGRDNMLFVIKKRKFKISFLLDRIILFFKCILLIPKEIFI